jgi:hypothetical protein
MYLYLLSNWTVRLITYTCSSTIKLDSHFGFNPFTSLGNGQSDGHRK